MIVLDASAAFEIVLRTDRGMGLAARIVTPGAALHVPHLIDVEVAHALRRRMRNGDTTEARAREALGDLAGLPLFRWPHQLLLERALDLCANATAYDAVYLALAEGLDATLITCDKRLAKVPGHGAVVEVV